MAQRVRHRSRRQPGWTRLLKGLGAAVAVTVIGVAVFALLMQWPYSNIRPLST